jgi:tripartite-type tricarboxylate transporter receptor subunit TctC
VRPNSKKTPIFIDSKPTSENREGCRINKEINAALADPKMKARLADLDGIAIAGSPADFGKLIAEEIEKWAQVIRAANIKVE